VWAFVHLIANGDVASLILFGSLLVLVFVGMISIDGKRKKNLWPALGFFRRSDFDYTLPSHQGRPEYAGNRRIQSLAIGYDPTPLSRRDAFSPSLVRGFPVVLRTFMQTFIQRRTSINIGNS
jgi:NnrU protein